MLTSFVAALPRPVERVPTTAGEIERVASGHKLFKLVGCATCHQPRMGNVAGLYSDLLVHDMGPGPGRCAGSRPLQPPGRLERQRSGAFGNRTARRRKSQRRRRQPGMAHSAALGSSRFGPVPARRSGCHARAGDRHARRRRGRVSAGLCSSRSERKGDAHDASQVARRPDQIDGPTRFALTESACAGRVPGGLGLDHSTARHRAMSDRHSLNLASFRKDPQAGTPHKAQASGGGCNRSA